VKKTSAILLVMSPSQRRRALIPRFHRSGAEILLAGSCRRARQVLRTRADITVAVTDLTLNDGNWCDVLESTIHREVPTSVVVVSPVGGERLWAEVLWRGAHDLLVEPLEDLEVRRTLESATRASLAPSWAEAVPPGLGPAVPPATTSVQTGDNAGRARESASAG
jgi:DNA-binding NtrC family response regulator